MSIGKIKEFDVRSGLWSSYTDRLEMYFVVNKIAEELKLPTLIASMGDEAYELLVNLASPKKPAELSYAQASELLRQHLQPAPSSLEERYRFRQKRQGATEDVAAYVAELKKLSRNCKFNANLNENLRDQFICGLRSDVIRQRLFVENEAITFTEAVKLAGSLEAAERDVAEVEWRKEATDASMASSVHALTPSTARVGQGRGRKSGGAGPAAPSASWRARPGMVATTTLSGCAACGATNHEHGRCRYRNFVCSKCQRVGHLRRVCPEREEQRSQADSGRQNKGSKREVHFGDYDLETSVEEDIEELNLLSLNNYKAVANTITKDLTILEDSWNELKQSAIPLCACSVYSLYASAKCPDVTEFNTLKTNYIRNIDAICEKIKLIDNLDHTDDATVGAGVTKSTLAPTSTSSKGDLSTPPPDSTKAKVTGWTLAPTSTSSKGDLSTPPPDSTKAKGNGSTLAPTSTSSKGDLSTPPPDSTKAKVTGWTLAPTSTSSKGDLSTPPPDSTKAEVIGSTLAPTSTSSKGDISTATHATIVGHTEPDVHGGIPPPDKSHDPKKYALPTLILILVCSFGAGILVAVVSKLAYDHYKKRSYVLPPEQGMQL